VIRAFEEGVKKLQAATVSHRRGLFRMKRKFDRAYFIILSDGYRFTTITPYAKPA
jgi:hypothetical protein